MNIDQNNSNKFVPKKYLENNIDSSTCNHLIVSTSGLEEGLNGWNYDWLICGCEINFPYYQNLNCTNKYVVMEFGYLTRYKSFVVKKIIQSICQKYYDKDSINIVEMLNILDKEIEKIS